MDTKVDWDELVGALRDELQEKGGLIGLLNRQTETLYRRDTAENERLEGQILIQLELISRSTARSGFCRKTECLGLSPGRRCPVQRSDPHVSPILCTRCSKHCFQKFERLSSRVKERLKQNEGLKARFLFEPPSAVECLSNA